MNKELLDVLALWQFGKEVELPEGFIEAHGVFKPGEPYNKAALEKIIPISEISGLISEAVKAKKHVLLLSGSFDVLHIGHYFYLNSIKSLAKEVLKVADDNIFIVVVVDSDNIVAQLKDKNWASAGGNRYGTIPIDPLIVRVLKLSCINVVNLISVLQGSPADIEALQYNFMKKISLRSGVDLGRVHRVIPLGESYSNTLKEITLAAGLAPFLCNISTLQTTANIMRSFAIESASQNTNPYAELKSLMEIVASPLSPFYKSAIIKLFEQQP